MRLQNNGRSALLPAMGRLIVEMVRYWQWIDQRESRKRVLMAGNFDPVDIKKEAV